MKDFLANFYLGYISFLIAGVVLLAAGSVLPLMSDRQIFGWTLLVLWLTWWYVLWKFVVDRQIIFSKIELLWTIPLWLVLVSRFPIYFPVYDDFAFHLVIGGYASDIWQAVNFLPLDFGTYVYPVAQLGYPYLLEIFGIRLSLLINGLLLIGWYISINLRLKSGEKSASKRMLWDIIFLYIFFVPHLMATHVTFMVDFLTLILSLEMFYQLVSARGNRTVGVIVGFLAMIIKQSSGVVVMPIFLYFVWQKKKDIKWRWVVLFLFLIVIYFVVSYVNTGNPIAFLYNSYFKSPLYSLANFKDTRWGPKGLVEVFLWPVIGQFTLRYGEGIVNTMAKYFFSAFSAVPYCLSWWFLLRRRKLKYGLFLLGYILWSVLFGYSRYLIVFVGVNWLWLINEEGLDDRFLRLVLERKRRLLIYLFFIFFCFSSIQTDFGWRPNLRSLTRAQPRGYFFSQYIAGLKLLGRDRLAEMTDGYKTVFDSNKVMVVRNRGPETLLAYLANIAGMSVVSAIDMGKYNEIVASDKIDEKIKSVIRKVDDENSFLLVGNKQWLAPDSIYWTKGRQCTIVDFDPSAWYFQSPTIFGDTLLYKCVKGIGGSR
ncbi:MAG: hypothetical protein WC841_01690 [Candidatus Shapirobacteria bacterium]|jgi:hypothetical protein